MEEQPYRTLNTREFIAKWDGALEEHHAAELAELLPQLMASSSSGSDLPRERFGALAHHLAHALHLAGAGGAQAGVEYLQQVADGSDNSRDRATNSS